jgi:putative glutamine amidotransferase
MQLLNVAHGGTLFQDLRDEVPASLEHNSCAIHPGVERYDLIHEVRVVGDRLQQILQEQTPMVNSVHHQAIKKLGQSLVPIAYASDGIIEAVEVPGDRWVMAVQWHPEELTEYTGMQRLFQNFITSCQQAS